VVNALLLTGCAKKSSPADEKVKAAQGPVWLSRLRRTATFLDITDARFEQKRMSCWRYLSGVGKHRFRLSRKLSICLRTAGI
jgi:hypothetical protein